MKNVVFQFLRPECWIWLSKSKNNFKKPTKNFHLFDYSFILVKQQAVSEVEHESCLQNL